MKLLRRSIQRLSGAWSGGRRDADLAEELQLHIDMQTEDNIRSGMTSEEARRAARLKFGAMESIKESYRDQRGAPLLGSIVADLKYAARQLRGTPGFTAAAVLTIALGIGANTAMFSVMNTILWKPLPIPEPDRFVVLTRNALSEEGGRNKVSAASPAEFAYWRTSSDVLDHVAAFLRTDFNYTGGDVAEVWRGQRVSRDIFRAFGLRVLKGRTFTAEEDRPNGPRVAAISNALWKGRFAGDPAVTGKTISLGGESYTVVGVVEDSEGVLENEKTLTDVYVPFQLDPNSRELGQTFTVVARLKAGVTLQQAREQQGILTEAFRTKFPQAVKPKDMFSVEPYKDLYTGLDEADDDSQTYTMFGAVFLVLLIACVNVANLLLVRGANRRREIGIRIAIGAGRSRVIRQLLTECFLISAAGGVVGVLVGDVALRALIAANFSDLPRYWKFELDWRVMAFAGAACIVTALMFGVLPSLACARVDLNATLKDSGGRWGTGLRQNKTRALLVISEIGMAVILLVASSLLIRAFISLRKVDSGFDATNVLVLYTWMDGAQFTKTANDAATIRLGLDRVRSMPGVITASSAGYVPLAGNFGLNFDIVGREPVDGSSTGHAGWVPVSSGYFDVFKIPLKRGREFTDRDDGKSPPVAVINEAMAKQYWKDSDPMNDRIMLGRGSGTDWADGQPRQIVGIVGDVRQRALATPPEPRIYVPQAQLPDAITANFVRLGPNAWIVRAQNQTQQLSGAIQQQIRQTTGLPVKEVDSMNRIVASSVEVDRFVMIIMSSFAAMAVFLAAVGIYGVMSYSVQLRTQEIGIRIALGAEASQARNMVVRHGFTLTIVGVGIGLGAAWELAVLLQSFIFGVQPRDPVVFITVPIVLTAVALLAIWFPAARASRISAMESLRCE
jgi:putative ABC transport system permease protein